MNALTKRRLLGIWELVQWSLILAWALFLALTLSAAPTLNPQPSTLNLLPALRLIESGGNPAAVGRAGERGAYQFTRSGWAEANRLAGTAYPFRLAHHEPTAAKLAVIYLTTLQAALLREHIHTVSTDSHRNARAIFCAWNLGYRGFRLRGFDVNRCPRSTRDAAARFANLVLTAERQNHEQAKSSAPITDH